MRVINTTVFGMHAQDHALQYLKDQGLVLMGSNFITKFGELDLVMQDVDGTLVFVEVRKRIGHDQALESISSFKQKKLILAAQYFLSKRNMDVPCRFDAVLVNRSNEVLWFKNIIEV